MSERIWCFRLPNCQGKMITLPGPEVTGMVFALTSTLIPSVTLSPCK